MQFINLPDGRLVLLNGAALGTAGYGTEAWAIGQSYADQPLHQAWCVASVAHHRTAQLIARSHVGQVFRPEAVRWIPMVKGRRFRY
jgi:hypothetical protein